MNVVLVLTVDAFAHHWINILVVVFFSELQSPPPALCPGQIAEVFGHDKSNCSISLAHDVGKLVGEAFLVVPLHSFLQFFWHHDTQKCWQLQQVVIHGGDLLHQITVGLTELPTASLDFQSNSHFPEARNLALNVQGMAEYVEHCSGPLIPSVVTRKSTCFHLVYPVHAFNNKVFDCHWQVMKVHEHLNTVFPSRADFVEHHGFVELGIHGNVTVW